MRPLSRFGNDITNSSSNNNDNNDDNNDSNNDSRTIADRLSQTGGARFVPTVAGRGVVRVVGRCEDAKENNILGKPCYK